MATSESDCDYGSSDELPNPPKKQFDTQRRYKSIGSDSDDDLDYIPNQAPSRQIQASSWEKDLPKKTDEQSGDIQKETKSASDVKKNLGQQVGDKKSEDKTKKESSSEIKSEMSSKENTEKAKQTGSKRERPQQRERKPKESLSLGAKKLGATKIDKLPDVEATTPKEVKEKAISEGKPAPLIQECWEECNEKNLEQELKDAANKEQTKKENSKKEGMKEPIDMPAELLSNLKFKDIFKPDGWEGLGEDVELPDDLSDDKYQPVLNKLAAAGSKEEHNAGWGSWGSWGMTSLLNTATAGVSTLTTTVSQGLSLLEETIGVPDPTDLAQKETPIDESPNTDDKELKEPKEKEKEKEEPIENQAQYLPSSFGFGNFMSSVSSITKLVESTSSKVISGGLDTLEVIGKKTMEVLQEGDPGLKKKRAFFSNEGDKPILSQVLREAKEKADAEEKTIEEKELARKIHLESLFDDYQGLVHLEALEMLSKQCNMKIQQQLVNLDGSELTSMQETLDEVKELCDLGEEEEEDEVKRGLKEKLHEACKDLGVSITYDKLITIWEEMNSKLSASESKVLSHRELFQKAISALAQFTAYSVERFHKTAELLLIKERRSTVNEADSLVQLTKALSSQIAAIAKLYCDQLNELKNESEKSEINSSISTISLEATNAITYVQEAFRLLIPILQVGAM